MNAEQGHNPVGDKIAADAQIRQKTTGFVEATFRPEYSLAVNKIRGLLTNPETRLRWAEILAEGEKNHNWHSIAKNLEMVGVTIEPEILDMATQGSSELSELVQEGMRVYEEFETAVETLENLFENTDKGMMWVGFISYAERTNDWDYVAKALKNLEGVSVETLTLKLGAGTQSPLYDLIRKAIIKGDEYRK